MENTDREPSSGFHGQCNGYLLAVDVDEILRCTDDLKNARWGIRWYWDEEGGITVEIYDKMECLKVFADQLRGLKGKPTHTAERDEIAIYEKSECSETRQ